MDFNTGTEATQDELEILDRIAEDLNEPYVMGNQEHAYKMLPYIEAFFPGTKMYEVSNVQYICATETAVKAVKDMLEGKLKSIDKEITQLRALSDEIEVQLYGEVRTQTQTMLQHRNDYHIPGSTIYGEIGLALNEVSTDDMIKYFRTKVSGGESLMRNYVEEQIISNEINKSRWENSRENGMLPSDVFKDYEMER